MSIHLMTKADLDSWAAGGCAVEGCDHQDHTNTMFLHSLCHTGAPLVVISIEKVNALGVCCIECAEPLCILSVKELGYAEESDQCCKDEIYWASYAIGSGVVKFFCYSCRKETFQAVLN
jgi:hypothetical protein